MADGVAKVRFNVVPLGWTPPPSLRFIVHRLRHFTLIELCLCVQLS